MTKTYLFKRLLLDLIYPNRCGFCGCNIPFDEYFCRGCAKRFAPPPQNVKIAHTDEFGAATAYDSLSRPFAAKFKEENDGCAISGAAYLIYKNLLREGALRDFDVITFVPMRKKDVYRRGYNQTKLIARELSWLTDKPCAALLKKVRDTEPQKALNAAERAENVRDAFRCTGEKAVKGKTVLIIDDISTTGSTLSEAARALKKAGAGSVKAAVFAKTVSKKEKNFQPLEKNI
ncbi:MAG: ComF family protein [Bacteroides sp.]|nr:ComF family protein [Bacteroides sp.]